MKRKEFGELISALRQDLSWTQFQLAERVEVDWAIISQIERGVKKHFEPQFLFKLANAFQLTTLERREFLLAASGLDQKEMVRQPSAATQTDVFNVRIALDKMIDLTGQVRLPAFLSDVYGDILAANNTILSFFKVPSEYLGRAAQTPGGYNMIHFAFGKDLVARSLVIDKWDEFALNTMRAFRENSLRYRAKPYFKYLMKAFRDLNEYPLFDRYWKAVSSTEQDKEAMIDYFSYHHERFGDIRYISSATVSVTSFGELFLVQYQPLDEDTGQVFEQLAQQAGPGVERFAPWPDKAFPRLT